MYYNTMSSKPPVFDPNRISHLTFSPRHDSVSKSLGVSKIALWIPSL